MVVGGVVGGGWMVVLVVVMVVIGGGNGCDDCKGCGGCKRCGSCKVCEGCKRCDGCKRCGGCMMKARPPVVLSKTASAVGMGTEPISKATRPYQCLDEVPYRHSISIYLRRKRD